MLLDAAEVDRNQTAVIVSLGAAGRDHAPQRHHDHHKSPPHPPSGQFRPLASDALEALYGATMSVVHALWSTKNHEEWDNGA